MVTHSWTFIQNVIYQGLWIWKTNTLFNLISHQPYADEIYLYGKDSCDAKYQLLTSKRQNADSEHLNGSKAFLNILIKKKNVKYWSYLMIWLQICLSIKKLNTVVNYLFIRGRKLHLIIHQILTLEIELFTKT